jgi:hypothetical protein
MMGAFEFPSCPTGVSKKGFKEFWVFKFVSYLFEMPSQIDDLTACSFFLRG